MKNLILQFILVSFFLLLFIPKGSAVDIDSLQSRLTSEQSEENCSTLLLISKEYVKYNPDTAYYYSQKAYKIADFLSNNELLSKALAMEAECYYYLKEDTKAVETYKRSIELLEKLRNKKDQIELYSRIALIYYDSNNLTASIKNSTKALELAVLENDLEGQISSLKDIGDEQRQSSKYDIALEYYFKALDLAKENNIEKDEARILASIGKLHNMLKERKLASEYFAKSLNIYKIINDSSGIADLYNDIGLVFKSSKQYDSALVYYNSALVINRALNNWQAIGYNFNNIGNIYNLTGDYNKALEYFFKSADAKKIRGRSSDLISSYINIGLVYLKKNEPNIALEYFNKSLNIAKSYNWHYELGFAYYKIYKVLVELGDYKNALENYKLYNAYRDSVLDEKMEKAILETQTKYETDEKENENRLLKKEKALNSKVRIYLIIISVSMGIILIFLIYFFVQKSKLLKKNRQFYEKEKQLNSALKKTSDVEKQRLKELIFAEQKINELQNDKIIAKNKELSSIVLSDHNKNKILDDLEKEIELIEKEDKFDKQALKRFKHIVSGTQVIEDDWLTFKEQIEKVYARFFEKLNKHCPSLTIYEQRLSAYLLIDMSTKEISKIFNVTIAAVNKSRQRLRKKLNIDSNEDFSKFLRQI